MDLIGSAHSRQAMDSEWARDTVGFKTRSIRQELWWNIEGIVHFKLFPNGCDISSEFYCQQLERVYTKLKQKSRFWSTERERWCSRIMPSHTPPGRPNTSLKSWRHWGSTTCSLQSWLCCMRLRPFKLNATFSEGTPIRLVWWSQGSMSRILWFEVGWTTRSESLPMDGKKTLEKWWSLFWRIIFVVYILYKTLKIKRYLFMKKEFKVLKKISQPLIKYLCGLNI